MAKRPATRAGLIAGAIVTLFLLLAGAGLYQMRASADPPEVSNGITLSPDNFEGDTRQAYLVAQQHPDLLAQFDCYCGCEQHEGHKNLLDCFRTNHGAGCATCVGEAVTAGRMFDQGAPVDQIRNALRERYGSGG
ncbi:MAG TPA: CYCXC family (seleno)protein [Candidatus Binataceae bacterium]|nr:CYCXC family (seleno)protein [Candidatus Binataceae bacterium]